MSTIYKKPCCYFYIDAKGEVAYVGKANGSLAGRVRSHAYEERFKNYSPTYTVKYLEFDTPSDMDVAELAFIKSLNPPLNIQGKTYGYFPKFDVDISKLKTYIPPKHYIDAVDGDIYEPENIIELKEQVLDILERHNGRETFHNRANLIKIIGNCSNTNVSDIWIAVSELTNQGIVHCKTTGINSGGRPTFLITLNK